MHYLGIIVLFSILVRSVLSFKGGQMFWFDEMRFWNGYYILTTIADYEYLNGLKIFITNFDHTLFQIFSIVLQGIRYFICKTFIDGDLQPYMLMESGIGLNICTSLLSCTFAFSIIMMNKILVIIGANKNLRIKIICCFAMSCSLIPYSRHLLPYDLAISIYLLSIYLILNKSYLVAGAACMFSILMYNGYSALFYATVLFSILFIISNETKLFLKITSYFIGVASILVVLQLFGYIVNINYLYGLLEWKNYAQLFQQGDFGIGYKIFFEYLWETESLFIIILILPIIFFKQLIFHYHTKNILFLGLFFCSSIFFILILQSDIIGNAVLYSRTINQIIPFLCIICGCGIYHFLSIKRIDKYKIYFFLFGLFVWIYNFTPIIQMRFPSEIKQRTKSSANKIYDKSEFSKHKKESIIKLENENNQLLINCSQIFPGIKYYTKYHLSNVKWTIKHPYQYKPYQFMHFNKLERDLLERYPPEIRLGY